jgi:hypothetical protein
MLASVLEKKQMHYPVMTERQVALRWKISLRTLRRWRLDNEGPIWHKLFHHVRYHEADIIEFERQSAQHWMAILGDRERVPRVVTHPPKKAADQPDADAAEPDVEYFSAKEIVEATGLPAHMFTDRVERERKRIPHLLLVRNLRFSLDAILQWELANSVRGDAKELKALPVAPDPEPEPKMPVRVPRWYEVVQEQSRERVNSKP